MTLFDKRYIDGCRGVCATGGSGALDPGTHKGGKAVSHSIWLLFDRRKIKEQNTLVVVITFISFFTL